MKRWVFAVVLIGLLAAALVFSDRMEWAGVTVHFGDMRFAANLAVFILALIGVLIVMRFVGTLLGLPKRLMQIGRERRLAHWREEFERGVSLYLQGQWERAYKHFLQATQDVTLAYAANLLAARCAIQERLFDEARSALQAAREINIEDDFGPLLIQSEVLLESGRVDQAVEHLQQLHRRRPDNRKVVDLLIRACETTGDWKSLADSLSQLRKLYVRQPERLYEVSVAASRELLQQAAAHADRGALEKQWREVDAVVKPTLLATYAKMLAGVGAYQNAEKLLREAIEARWDEGCMVYYGDMEGGNVDERLRHAERWLKSRPKDPALLLCLGKLYRQAELWDQARHYLKASFSLAPKAETFRELTSVFDYVGENRFD